MGTTKGTQQKVIVYSGELYTDAERIASAANSTVAESCTTPGTKTVANKDERKLALLKLLETDGMECDEEAYAAASSSYTEFCRRFFLNADKYKLDYKAITHKKPDPPKPMTTADELRQIGTLLDMLLENQRESNKMLQSLVAGIGSTVSTLERNSTENMECLHKLGPKVGEMDKKLKNIEVGMGTVARSYPGLVTNVANLWGRFERWTKR